MRYSRYVVALLFALILAPSIVSAQAGTASFATCIGDIGNCDKVASSVNLGPTVVNEGSFVPVQFINSGSAPLTMNYSFSSPAFAFGLQQTLPPNPLVVQPGSSVQTFMVFTPTAAGLQTGQFVSNDNAPGAPHVIPLSATGVSVADNDLVVMLDPTGPSSFALKAGSTTSFPVYVLVGAGQNPSNSGGAQCSGGPPASTCTLQPTAFPGFITQQKLIISVQVPAKTGSLQRIPLFWAGMAGFSAIVLLCRRRPGKLLLVTFLFCAVTLVSCGGGSASSPPIVVTAGVGAVTHSLSVPVTVQ